MKDYPGKPGRKPQGFKAFPAQLWPDQDVAIRAEAATRGERQGNAVLRDVIDFWAAHYPLFRTWIANRGNSPREPIA